MSGKWIFSPLRAAWIETSRDMRPPTTRPRPQVSIVATQETKVTHA